VVLNCCVTETNDTPLLVEHLDDLGEVRERAGQPVDLVDDDGIDRPARNISQQPLQGRPLQGAARETAIIVRL
jgi:hypothetical protein